MGQARLGMGAGKGGHHLGGNQRTVHHQAGIALGAGHVGMVIMDAMTVEGHRRIAEQQHGRGIDRIAPLRLGRGFAARKRGRRRLPVDDVLLFQDDDLARLVVFVAHGHEQQRPGAARLFLDLGHRGYAFCGHAHLQRLAEFHPAARPHAVAVLGRRQETAARGMAIRPQSVHTHRADEERPLPQGRQGLALGRRGAAQGGCDARRVAGIHRVRLAFAAADPACRICRSHADILWWGFFKLKHARKPSRL
ncbi:hypothetical protein G6F57_014795 [Rhizopus arrhizus]|nr:hypothetical protein G6F57_014795 [Rhizopus arrhizus]